MGTIHGNVPVNVHVDDGEITKVVVIDELIVFDSDQPNATSSEVALAEGDAEWPGWDFGY